MDKLSTEFKVKDFIKNANGELVRLADFDTTKEHLDKICQKHIDLVPSEENIKECKDAVRELRTLRYGLQNVQKHNNDILNTAKAELRIQTEDLINLIQPREKKLDLQVKEIELEKKRKKEKELEAERERVSYIKETMAEHRATLKALITNLNIVTLGDIENLKIEIEDLIEDEFYQEFEFDGVELLDEVKSEFEKGKISVKKQQEAEEKLLIQSRKNTLNLIGLDEEDGIWSYEDIRISNGQIEQFRQVDFDKFLKRVTDRKKEKQLELEIKERQEKAELEELRAFRKEKELEVKRKKELEDSLKERLDLAKKHGVKVSASVKKKPIEQLIKHIDNEIALICEEKRKGELAKIEAQRKIDLQQIKPLIKDIGKNINTICEMVDKAGIPQQFESAFKNFISELKDTEKNITELL